MTPLARFRFIAMAVALCAAFPAIAQVTAPAWNLPCIYGTNINSTNFTGRVVLLNFFCTWCGPCCAEIPSLIALQQKYAPDGLRVVGLSLDSSPDGVNPPTTLVSNFVASYGINYPVVMDAPADRADILYGTIEYGSGGYIEYIPNTFIIDRHNDIVQTYVGEQSYSTYESAVLPLIYANLTLSLSVSNSQVCVTWPTIQATCVVQQTTNLGSGVWTNVTATVQTNGTNSHVTLPKGPSPEFFRLQVQ
jgi:thiol-disulfide isomerase/thioredoxin